MNSSIGFAVGGFVIAVIASIFAPESVSDLFLFAGLGVAYLGFLGYIAIWKITGVRLFDERERQIERKAGQIIMLIVITVTLFGLPADLVLDVTGAVDVPSVLRGVIWGYSALSFIMLFVYGYVENKHS
jgi:hypothetical protein